MLLILIQHGEYMGMEQEGIMKQLPTPVLKTAIDGEIDTKLNPVKGTEWVDENLVDHEERITQNESDIGYLEIDVADMQGTGWNGESFG